jgi:hypothetical protein
MYIIIINQLRYFTFDEHVNFMPMISKQLLFLIYLNKYPNKKHTFLQFLYPVVIKMSLFKFFVK